MGDRTGIQWTDATPRDGSDGVWMTTASGQQVNVQSPAPSSIEIVDIAGALSKICRFAGQTSRFYSVAEHSSLVSDLLPRRLALHGLLHDAHEAYLGDMIAPVKHAVRTRTSWVQNAERDLDAAIAARFGLPELSTADRAAIKYADLIALATERRDLMPDDGLRWPVLDGIEPADLTCTGHPHNVAEFTFLARFSELAGAQS